MSEGASARLTASRGAAGTATDSCLVVWQRYGSAIQELLYHSSADCHAVYSPVIRKN